MREFLCQNMLRSCFRSFHLCNSFCSAVDTGLLAKLRKSTGYSISNCKKALEVNNNDWNSAEKWLREMAKKEGWEKAIKLRDRAATQGLIAIHIHDNSASIVEVSCETDFVARNSCFKDLVRTVATAVCASQMVTQPHTESYSIIRKSIMSSELQHLQWKETKLTDSVAVAISQLGENIILRRAVTIIAGDGIHLSAYCHPAEQGQPATLSGKHGAIVAFKQTKGESEVGLQLCQHVIGMNPLSVGSEESQEADNKDEETVLLHQEFLLNPDMTVAEYLAEETAQVLDFVKFSCGETSS